MAKKKKKENTLSYLQMPLPEGVKYSKMTKVSFGGLNNRYTLDSGELSMESNISTKEYPYLTPSEKRTAVFGTNKTPYYKSDDTKIPISMFAFDNFIVVVYYEKVSGTTLKEYIKLDYITEDGTVHTGIIKSGTITDDDLCQRSIVQFNVYDVPTDVLTGQYVKKLLIFPDCVSMFMNIEERMDDFNAETADINTLYWHENENKKIYTYIKSVKGDDGEHYREETTEGINETDSDDKYTGNFLCDNMIVEIKEFSTWTKTEKDDEGNTTTTTMETPPETASHNYYYFNKENNLTYRWIDDESDSANSGWKVSTAPAMPKLKYATVHLSRVFGVDDDRVYASGFNSYGNWNLDAVDEYNESNAWCSPSQSNTKAGGEFTGITTFQNHVICFKRDFMHEIYNTKNPFRLQDIYAEGAIDNRTIQDVDGRLIFVSEDDVKIYTGSNPRIIGYNLNMPRYTYAVSGTDNRNYFLYCEDGKSTPNRHLYVYDTFTEMWSEQAIEYKVLSFAHNKNGMYMLCDNGEIYQMDTGDYNHEWSFETDIITNKTVDIKHIKKLQMLVDIPDANSNMQVYILYDNEVFNEETSHCVFSSKKNGRLPIRVKPRNTANYGFRLHFKGKGYAKLYELEIFIEQGGALYV